MQAGATPRRPTRRALLRHYVQGLLMGAADVVPGVSGGTIALVVGVYRALVESIGHLAAAIARAARGDLSAAREHASSVAWGVVIPLGAGVVTAVLVAAQFLPDLIDRYPVQSRAFFFGMIGGSIVIPWRRIGAHGAVTVVALAAGVIAGFLVTGLPDREASDPSLVRVFASAMVAICAMILPGVSGAFLLVVLGIYERSLDAIRDRDIAYVATFLAGAALGLGLFSMLLRWLLARAHDVTMAALVGLMAGALRALWPYLDDDRAIRGPQEGEPVIAAVALVAVGLAGVLLLAWLSERNGARGTNEASDASVAQREE